MLPPGRWACGAEKNDFWRCIKRSIHPASSPGPCIQSVVSAEIELSCVRCFRLASLKCPRLIVVNLHWPSFLLHMLGGLIGFTTGVFFMSYFQPITWAILCSLLLLWGHHSYSQSLESLNKDSIGNLEGEKHDWVNKQEFRGKRILLACYYVDRTGGNGELYPYVCNVLRTIGFQVDAQQFEGALPPLDDCDQCWIVSGRGGARLAFDDTGVGSETTKSIRRFLKRGKASTLVLVSVAEMGDTELSKAAQMAFARRMGRLKASSLKKYLQANSPQLRLAAARAAPENPSLDLANELVVLITGPEKEIGEAANKALQKMTNKDFGSVATASCLKKKSIQGKWQA